MEYEPKPGFTLLIEKMHNLKVEIYVSFDGQNQELKAWKTASQVTLEGLL